MPDYNLRGARIGLLEARMESTLAALVRRLGGEPLCAPAVRELVQDCTPEVAAFCDQLAAGGCDTVVVLTGRAAQVLFETADQLGRAEELIANLQRRVIVARGPKPAAVLRQWGVQISAYASAPYTADILLDVLAGLPFQSAAVLHYGERSSELTNYLQGRGATVTDLCLYEWRLPEDRTPLDHLIHEIVARRIDAVAFTSQIQVRHLLMVADEAGLGLALRAALERHVIIVAVGPTCAEALHQHHLPPDVVPDNPKMAPMLNELARYLDRQRALPLAS